MTTLIHPQEPRVRSRRDWLGYSLIGFCAVVTVAFVAWQHETAEVNRNTLRITQAAMQWRESCSTIEQDLVGLYAAVVQPPGLERENLTRILDHVRKVTDSHVSDLRRELSAATTFAGKDGLLAEWDEVKESVDILMDELANFPAAPGRSAPGKDATGIRLASVGKRFAEAQRRLTHFSANMESVGEKLRDSQQRAERWHETVDAAILAILASFGASSVVLFAKGRRGGRASPREREQLRSELRKAEARYRSIFDNAVEGLFQTTPDGRFISANKALARMYGYQSPEHLMASLSDIGRQLYVEPEQRKALLEALQTEELVSNFEIEAIRADGRTMWIRENVRAVRDESGCLLYLEGTVEDVSDRWWSEQRRRLQYATARVLDRSASVAEARPMILKTICEILDWDMGAVWDVNSELGVLECVEVWHATHIDIQAFQEVMSETSYHPGEGLAGEVWESGEPKWIAELGPDARSIGARMAVEQGMGSAFCVPIKVQGEVRHVVEFFSPKISLPDPELLQTLGVVGNQLGHLIERKSAEVALRKSEMRKAAILLSALDCIISFDPEGRILEFNPAAERAFGIRQVDALGRDIVELMVPESLRASHRRGVALYNSTSVMPGLGRRVELTALHSTGREFPVEVAISRINIDGRAMFTAFVRDISERKQAEQLTSELAAVVANSNDAIIGCTLEGAIRSWNVGAERIYGWTAEEVIGSSLMMLMPPDRLDEYPRMLTAVRMGESLANYETVRLRKDGKKISVSLTDSPIRSEQGAVVGLSSIARDITERKRLEEDLLQSQKMDAVGRLAGGIAHDFNNVLTAILGYSDLLIGQIESRHWMYRHLSEIRKAADFAASLTHQLLAFSRRQPLYLRVFSINDAVRNLQKMLQRVIGEQIKIRTEFAAEIGRLKADPSQIEQVLLNLCVNARDAMPKGGSITISTADVTYFPDANAAVSEMPAGEYVKLTVSDHGTGMEAETIKHIFEPFFTTKELGKGTGLGLATCYGIVKQSGGYITVDSKVGVGTSFSIYLPRVEESGEKAATRKEVGQLPGGSEIILYVEDELSVRGLTSHVLRRLGYTVLEAGDAQQARTIVESHSGASIDLLLSDVVLPDVGGKQLADWVSSHCPKISLLFTSGYVDESVLRQHGITEELAFLQKPFTPAELARIVRDVLDQARAATDEPNDSETDAERATPLRSIASVN